MATTKAEMMKKRGAAMSKHMAKEVTRDTNKKKAAPAPGRKNCDMPMKKASMKSPVSHGAKRRPSNGEDDNG